MDNGCGYNPGQILVGLEDDDHDAERAFQKACPWHYSGPSRKLKFFCSMPVALYGCALRGIKKSIRLVATAKREGKPLVVSKKKLLAGERVDGHKCTNEARLPTAIMTTLSLKLQLSDQAAEDLQRLAQSAGQTEGAFLSALVMRLTENMRSYHELQATRADLEAIQGDLRPYRGAAPYESEEAFLNRDI